MAVFVYRAVPELRASSQRRAGRGTVSADSPRQARELLQARGLRVKELTPLTGPDTGRVGSRRQVRPQRLSGVVRELATLLGAGIPLLTALESVAQQRRGPIHDSLMLLRDRVAGGVGFAEAMAEQPSVYDDLTVQMVSVGERSGQLDAVLQQLGAFQARGEQLRGRLGTALIYPAIVVVAGVGVTVFLMTGVVPGLLQTLEEAGRPLPLATRIVKAASDMLLGYWWLLLVGIGGLATTAAVYARRPRQRRRVDRLVLSIPVIGDLLRKQLVVRVAVTLAVLTRSGVEFVPALRIVRGSIRNAVVADALRRAEEAVSNGWDIAPALADTRAFPPTVVQLVDVGQASGKLDEMLERLATEYDAQVQLAAQRLLAVLEPALVLALGVFILFIVLAVILPYLEISNVL